MAHAASADVIRQLNRSQILDLVREQGPFSRGEIASRLHLSLPSVARTSEALIAEGLLRRQGSRRTGGRPCALVEFDGRSRAVVAIDLGGSKMFGVVADLAGTVQHEVYRPHREGAAHALQGLEELIAELLQAPRPAGQRIWGIGIGAPGVTDSAAGVVLWAPSLAWRDQPLGSLLGRRFGLPVLVENDVNLIALGELGFGAGRGARHLICIAVGTGIGSGIVIDGALYRGHNWSAGEIGYMLPGVSCLGRRYDQFGALESLASGSGIAERARQILAQQGKADPAANLSAVEVFAAAHRGEPWARQVLDETIDYLALAIANAACLLDPEVVILGGGVARGADLLLEPIRERLQGVVPFVPRLAVSTLGYRAGVLGAIMLILRGVQAAPRT